MKCSECFNRHECDYYKNSLCNDDINLIWDCNRYLRNSHKHCDFSTMPDNTQWHRITISVNRTIKSVENLGITVRDTAGNMKSLNSIFDELREKMLQFSTQERGDNN